ncbi:MAG: DUF6199 family natural product biosynthesis protein [Anaerocolumna sp.]
MYLLISILFIIGGVSVVVKPMLAIELINMFRFNQVDEPTNLYVFSTRFGGFMFMLVGLIYLIVNYIL